MIQIYPKIREQFDTLLVQKNILKKHHPDYRKWLRYYLDFCNKYNYDTLKKESLSFFINKLRNKNHTIPQQRQAYDAVLLYYEIEKTKSIKEKDERGVENNKCRLDISLCNVT